MRLLVTRPEPDCERTARILRAGGHEAIAAPLLRVEPVRDAPVGPGPWAAIVFTSANAVNAVASHPAKAGLTSTPVFTVGARTEEAARAAAFSNVQSAYGDVTAVAALVAERVAERANPVLYLAGEDRAGDLEGLLAARGLAVRTVVIYRAVAASRLPDAARGALVENRVDGALHYSKRTAKTFIAAAAADGLADRALSLRHFCLSAEVAAPLVAAGAAHVAIAGRPNQQALFALLDD